MAGGKSHSSPQRPSNTHLSPLAKKASNSAAILQDRAGWLCSAEQLVTTRWEPGDGKQSGDLPSPSPVTLTSPLGWTSESLEAHPLPGELRQQTERSLVRQPLTCTLLLGITR